MVEEIVAVVGRTPILRSDLALAALVRLGEPDAEELDSPVYRSRLLDLRIRLELQLRDLEASGILFRLEPPVTEVLAELAARAGGEDQLRARLPGIGLRWSDVEELALRIAAARCYVEQRLRPQITVRAEELEQAYQRLVTEQLPAGTPPPPREELEGQLRRLLEEQKLNTEIERWLAQARERLRVTRYVRS